MNTGMITSFAVAGLLLVSILAMNLNISRSATGMTMRQITQQHVQTVAELLENDIPKLGYDQYATIPDAITYAGEHRIDFKSNIDNSGGTETVSWQFDTSAPLSASPNPDDYHLYRRVNSDQTDLSVGVTAFRFTYLDGNRNVLATPITSTSVLNSIRHIRVQLVVTSKEKLGNPGAGSAEYVRSSWEKTFSPKNIN